MSEKLVRKVAIAALKGERGEDGWLKIDAPKATDKEVSLAILEAHERGLVKAEDVSDLGSQYPEWRLVGPTGATEEFTRDARISKRIWARMRRVKIPAPIIAAIISAFLTFEIMTHLKPALSVEVAYSEVVTKLMKDKPNEFVTALLDQTDREILILGPTQLTFNSKNDFTLIPGDSLQITKMLVTNTGHAGAKRISMGIGFPTGTKDWKIVASPNVAITAEKNMSALGGYPAYRAIEFDRLGVSETAVFTIVSRFSCECPSGPPDNDGRPYIELQKEEQKGFLPLLFIKSDEGAINDERMISMKEALAEEKAVFPAISPGFWATGLKVRSGISPTVKSLDHWTIEVTIPGKDGKPQHLTLTTDHPVTVISN